MRRICYVTGTRADFGLLAGTLRQAARAPGLTVSLCVTGMHLLPEYGETVCEIEASGLAISARIPVLLNGSTGGVMARAIAGELLGMVDAFERDRPDLVVVLGDRGEMLAGALAAIHLNIPIVHIHGGERSGTVDEPIRHAISKLAHYHFVATTHSRQRLISMGEWPEHIFVTGAPGLDGLAEMAQGDRSMLAAKFDLDPSRPIALLVFHPVLQEWQAAGQQAKAVLDGVIASGCQALCLKPNSDAGGSLIRATLEALAATSEIRLVDHLPRDQYLPWFTACDVMVGNSSSGIIEAASFGLPVVNVGSRQDGRERSGNTVDVPPKAIAVRNAVNAALAHGRRTTNNVYGDGRAGERMVGLFQELPLTPDILKKTNAY